MVAMLDGLDEDNDPTDVGEPIGFDDTLSITNVFWPPFVKLAIGEVPKSGADSNPGDQEPDNGRCGAVKLDPPVE